MKYILSIFLFFSLVFLTQSQTNFDVLHYTETSGFDHGTRSNSLTMFNSFPNLTVVDDQLGVEFDSLNKLLSFDLIIFSNTSGSQLLDSTQQNHFEQYIDNGGHIIGIHAATDTYRHSTANGTNTGVWDFYAETLGGSVQRSPNHVSGTPLYDISVTGSHPTTQTLPNPWSKNEEYYYWENGYLDTSIKVVLEVEQTVGPNSLVNSYDSARAVSWYKEIDSTGSKIFYTSLGHANSNYTSDTTFKKHIQNAVEWCLSITTDNKEFKLESMGFSVYPNPSNGSLNVNFSKKDNYDVSLFNLNGQLILSRTENSSFIQLNVQSIPRGIYLLNITNGVETFNEKVVVN